MEFSYLESFIKIADYKSFSKAAEIMGYSQSALSVQISKLETELNVSLFNRIGKNIYLTENGEKFYNYAVKTLNDKEKMIQSFSSNTTINGTIKIAVAHSLCNSEFSTILLSFHHKYPDVKFLVKTGLTKDMYNWLEHNECDMLYTLNSPICKPNLISLAEAEINIGFYVNKDHPLAEKKLVKIEDIKKYPTYLTEEGLSYRYILDKQLAEHGQSLDASIEIGDTLIIRNLILSNNGVGFIPEFVVKEDLKEGRIKRLNVEFVDIKLWKQVIYHKKKFITPTMNKLISSILNFEEKNPGRKL